MLFRTTLIIALCAPLLTNCSAVFQALDGQTANGDAQTENPIESSRSASVLGDVVEEGPTDCVPKPKYGQTPDKEEETDYPEEDTPPAGDTGQNQSDEPEEEKPSEEEPTEDEPKNEDPGKDQPVEDCK